MRKVDSIRIGAAALVLGLGLGALEGPQRAGSQSEGEKTPTPISTPEIKTEEMIYKVNVTKARIREDATTDSTILGTLTAGTVFTGEVGEAGWVHSDALVVTVNGKEKVVSGFVSASLLDVVTSPSAPQSPLATPARSKEPATTTTPVNSPDSTTLEPKATSAEVAAATAVQENEPTSTPEPAPENAPKYDMVWLESLASMSPDAAMDQAQLAYAAYKAMYGNGPESGVYLQGGEGKAFLSKGTIIVGAINGPPAGVRVILDGTIHYAEQDVEVEYPTGIASWPLK